MSGRKITVSAVWEHRIPATLLGSGAWVPYVDEQPDLLRASLAPKRLTVWLPSGMRVVCRRSWRQICDGKHTDRVFFHQWQDRYGDRHRIRFTIPEDVPLNVETKLDRELR